MTKVYLGLDELKRMEESCTNLRDQLLIRLLFKLDCRISETLFIKTGDIDFANGNITIIHLKRRIKLFCLACGSRLRMTHAFCPRCGAKIENKRSQEQESRRQRILPIDQDTLKLLKEYINRGGPVDKDGENLLFGIKRHRAWQIVKQCAEKAGDKVRKADEP